MQSLSIRVTAEGADGASMTEFTMKLESTFEKLMRAWCDQNYIPMTDARFMIDDRYLLPEHTPASLNWCPEKGILDIQVIPRNDEVMQSVHEKNPRQTDSASCAGANITSGDRKISIQVIAQGADGKSVLDFAMKMSGTFDKLMRAWCGHNGIAFEEALFEFDGHALSAGQTPSGSNWFSERGVLIVNAMPRSADEASKGSVNAAEQMV